MKLESEIRINTQSSIRLEKEKVIYFDPYKIGEKLSDADYIFITHNHYDHFDKNSINNIKKETTKLIVPLSMKEEVNDLVDNSNILYVLPNRKYKLDNISFKTTYSYNINKEFHKKEDNFVGYILDLGGLKYYIAGDTDFLKENKELEVDVALVPIGGKFTMDFKEAALFINTIKPKKVIPTHYGSLIGDKSLGKDFLLLINDGIECELVLK